MHSHMLLLAVFVANHGKSPLRILPKRLRKYAQEIVFLFALFHVAGPSIALDQPVQPGNNPVQLQSKRSPARGKHSRSRQFLRLALKEADADSGSSEARGRRSA